MKELLLNSLMAYSFSVKKKYQRLKIRAYENKAGILTGVAKFYSRVCGECEKVLLRKK